MFIAMTDFSWFERAVARFGLTSRRVDDGRLERIAEAAAQTSGHRWTVRAHHSIGVESPDTWLTRFIAPALAAPLPAQTDLEHGRTGQVDVLRDDDPNGSATPWGEGAVLQVAMEMTRAIRHRGDLGPTAIERVQVEGSPPIELSAQLLDRMSRWPGDAWYSDPVRQNGAPARTHGGREPLRVKVSVTPWQSLEMVTSVWDDTEQLVHAIETFNLAVYEFTARGIVVPRDSSNLSPPDKATVQALLAHAGELARTAKAERKTARAAAKRARHRR